MKWKRCSECAFTYSRKVVAAWLYGLYEESAGCRISVHSTDEILHWRLMGKTDQIAHMIHRQPRQMLRVMQVLTLRGSNPKMTIFVLWIYIYILNGMVGKQMYCMIYGTTFFYLLLLSVSADIGYILPGTTTYSSSLK